MAKNTLPTFNGPRRTDPLREALNEFEIIRSISQQAEDTKAKIKKVTNLGRAVGSIFRKPVIPSLEPKEDETQEMPYKEKSGGGTIVGSDSVDMLESIEKWTRLQYEQWGGKIEDDKKQDAIDHIRETEMWEELLAQRDKPGGGELVNPEKDEEETGGFMRGLVDKLLGGRGMGTVVKGLVGSMGKILFSPIGALITGAVWAIMDGVKGMFKFGGVSGFVGGLFGGMDSGVKGMFSGAGKWALIGAGIGSFVPVIGTLLGGAIGAVFGGILGFIGGEKISAGLKKMGAWIGNMWSGLVENIKNITKLVWDYSPLGMLVGTISKVINYFKKQEGDTIFDKLKAGMSNIKKGFGNWLLGIIPDVFGLGWLRTSIGKIFGVDAKGNSTDKENGDTTSPVSVDTDEKTGEPKEIVSREKRKIGLASSQLDWLSKIGEGIGDLIKVTKEKAIEDSSELASSGSYVGDAASDVMQDAWKGAGSFVDRMFPSKSQKEQQGLIISELKKSGITDPKAIANILAINRAESRFKPQSENMKYSAKRLMEVFPNRFSSYKDAQKVAAGGEKAIAEHLYGVQSKKGKELGNTDLGDGWKYRGRGLNQLTGKANYAKYGEMIGVDLVKNPDLVNDPVIAAKLNAAYYKDRSKGDLSKLKSGDSVMAMTGYTNAEMKAERRGYMAQNYASEEFQQGYAGTPSIQVATTNAMGAKQKMVADQTASRSASSGSAAIVNAPVVNNSRSSNTTVVAGRPAYRNNLDDQRLQMANGDISSAMS